MKKMVLVLVRVTFLIDATVPLGYEEMKTPEEKVNIEAVEAKTLYLGRG